MRIAFTFLRLFSIGIKESARVSYCDYIEKGTKKKCKCLTQKRWSGKEKHEAPD